MQTAASEYWFTYASAVAEDTYLPSDLSANAICSDDVVVHSMFAGMLYM